MSDQETIEQLKQELESLKRQNKDKSEFLSMVTHQLRTPLSGLKWVFNMLLKGDMGSFTNEQLEVIQKGADSNERMINLLQEIITANQTESWDFQYAFAKTDITPIIENLVTEFTEEASAHDLTITFKKSSPHLPLITIDAEKITSVLQNLFENAIKYSNGGKKIEVTLDEQDKDGKQSLLLSVQDHGIGIPEAAQDKIFEKFFRADNAKEQKKEGTGLGLFTAKNIIEKHGGNIWFESKEGRGTTFYCELPIT